MNTTLEAPPERRVWARLGPLRGQIVNAWHDETWGGWWVEIETEYGQRISAVASAFRRAEGESR